MRRVMRHRQYVFNYLKAPENNEIMAGLYIDGKRFIHDLIDFCDEQIENYNNVNKCIYLKLFCEKRS